MSQNSVSGHSRITKTIADYLNDLQRFTRQHSEFTNQLNAYHAGLKWSCRIIKVVKIS